MGQAGASAGTRLTALADMPRPDGMSKTEETLAHLIRTVDELSDVVAAQQREIDVLTRRVAMLMQREAEREADGSGGVVLGDERPPHY